MQRNVSRRIAGSIALAIAPLVAIGMLVSAVGAGAITPRVTDFLKTIITCVAVTTVGVILTIRASALRKKLRGKINWLRLPK